MTYADAVIHCHEERCEATLPDNRWAKTKAHPAWFFSRSGRAWCPAHVPAWAPMWRAREKS